jgi:Uma2 family endonuclease
MGMAASSTKLWTVDEVHALPDDGNRYEVVDGELFVSPAPTWQHGRAVRQLYLRMAAYIGGQPVADVILAPADVTYGPRTVVQPDLFAVPLVGGRAPRTWAEAGRLLLAVEVLSPGTARADRHVKRRLYQREGVPEYWIVDVDARLVERWRPEDERPEILVETLDWRPDAAHPPLVVDLPAYFVEVIGE